MHFLPQSLSSLRTSNSELKLIAKVASSTWPSEKLALPASVMQSKAHEDILYFMHPFTRKLEVIINFFRKGFARNIKFCL